MVKLAILGLAAYGGYTLWSQYGDRLTGLVNTDGQLADRRVESRSELNVSEWAAGSDDPTAQASAIIADSDARTDLSRKTAGVEHRTSQETVEP